MRKTTFFLLIALIACPSLPAAGELTVYMSRAPKLLQPLFDDYSRETSVAVSQGQMESLQASPARQAIAASCIARLPLARILPPGARSTVRGSPRHPVITPPAFATTGTSAQ